jgi:hypothetical protein
MVNWTSPPSIAPSILVIKLHGPLVVAVKHMQLYPAITQGDGGKERSRQELKYIAPYNRITMDGVLGEAAP